VWVCAFHVKMFGFQDFRLVGGGSRGGGAQRTAEQRLRDTAGFSPGELREPELRRGQRPSR
jgi:hypothetical protein